MSVPDVAEANQPTLLERVVAALRRYHGRPEFCDALDPRVVERDHGPNVVVCDGCADDPDVDLENPPILWRDGEGIVYR